MPTTVEVYGTLYATYEDDAVTRLVFQPAGSYAGYFGPAAVVVEGDEDLDVQAETGPFWRAVQAALQDSTWLLVAAGVIDDDPVEGPAIPIQWRE